MDTPNFFGDCVADMEVDADRSYSDAYDRDDKDSGGYPTELPGFGTAPRRSMASTPSFSQPYPTRGDQWSQSRVISASTETGISQLDELSGFPLYSSGPSQAASASILAPAATPETRSTTRTISSSDSITRKSKSTSASTNPPREAPLAPPPESPPAPQSESPPAPKKRRGRKGKVTTAAEALEKRDRFLERNRVAASKCRQKKKEYVGDLEDTKIGLESQNLQLQMEYNVLLSEVGRLKSQLMNHASCHDPTIDKWIENEARKFVQNTSDRYDHTYGTFDPMRDGRQLSMVSQNSAYAGTSSYEAGEADLRRDSMAFSHASSLQTSPVMTDFPELASPQSHSRRGSEINYDPMGQGIFTPIRQNFAGR